MFCHDKNSHYRAPTRIQICRKKRWFFCGIFVRKLYQEIRHRVKWYLLRKKPPFFSAVFFFAARRGDRGRAAIFCAHFVYNGTPPKIIIFFNEFNLSCFIFIL